MANRALVNFDDMLFFATIRVFKAGQIGRGIRSTSRGVGGASHRLRKLAFRQLFTPLAHGAEVTDF